jgi:hypothetical protein
VTVDGIISYKHKGKKFVTHGSFFIPVVCPEENCASFLAGDHRATVIVDKYNSIDSFTIYKPKKIIFRQIVKGV